MRLGCFSARRDGKTPAALKSAIVDLRGQLLISASLHRKKLSGLLLRSAIEQLLLGFGAVFYVVLVTTELFRLQELC